MSGKHVLKIIASFRCCVISQNFPSFQSKFYHLPAEKAEDFSNCVDCNILSVIFVKLSTNCDHVLLCEATPASGM